MFIDTHVVSYAKQGLIYQPVRGARISSVAASELLLVYGKQRTTANYYVPLCTLAGLTLPRRDHPVSRQSTDRIAFSFGSEHESLVEFGSLAIAKMLNKGNFELLRLSISFQSKYRQRIIRENFRFLVENEIRCIPLNRRTVEIGYRLLSEFSSSGERVKTTFRNTWNDILILASAWEHNDILWSEDNQLNRFAASQGEYQRSVGGTLKIRFPQAFSEE